MRVVGKPKTEIKYNSRGISRYNGEMTRKNIHGHEANPTRSSPSPDARKAKEIPIRENRFFSVSAMSMSKLGLRRIRKRNIVQKSDAPLSLFCLPALIEPKKDIT